MTGLHPVRPAWSVVIVNFDGGDLLRACVDSVLASFSAHPAAVEVIIVDNASTDGSAGLASVGRHGIHVQHNTTNAGFPRAVNAGLAAALGERVLVLNPDAEVDAAVFEAASAALEPVGPFALLGFAQEDDADLRHSTGPAMSTPEILRQVVLRRRGQAQVGPQETIAGHTFRRIVRGYVSGYCLAAPMARFRALEGFDSGLFWAEDVDLCLRARRAGMEVAVCTSATARHLRTYTKKRHAALVTFFQLTGKIGYTSRHSPRSVPLVVAAVGCVSALRWIWTALSAHRDASAREKSRAYRAVLRHLATRGWRHPEGWDPGLVSGLRPLQCPKEEAGRQVK